MAATIALRVVVVCMAVCGLAAAQDSYGTVYGDIGVGERNTNPNSF